MSKPINELQLWWRNFWKEWIQKWLFEWISYFLNLRYWWESYQLLTIHDLKENYDTVQFRYNNTYKVYWIYYWNYLFLYYNDHRNVRRTKELDRILWLMNKKDEIYETKFRQVFESKLKKYFWDKNLIKEIKKELEKFILFNYWKDKDFFKNSLEKFKVYINSKCTTITTWIWKSDKDDWVLYLDKNWVTIKAKKIAEPWNYYYFKWEQYYIAKNKEDIQKKIFKEWFDASKIVTTFITDLSNTFKDKKRFNSDITSWDTSNVTDMSSFLESSYKFNQNIFEYYDTSKVKNMSSMLKFAFWFNQPLTNLNTSNVINFENMLSWCTWFTYSVWHLNVEKWENFSWMLNFTNFKQSIKWWKPKSAKKIRKIFESDYDWKLTDEAIKIFQKYSKELTQQDFNEIK